jgi:hypothetical protein
MFTILLFYVEIIYEPIVNNTYIKITIFKRLYLFWEQIITVDNC